MLLAPSSARRVLGLISSVPVVGGRRINRPAAADVAAATSRAARSLTGRLAAPFLVLVILALTAAAALLPMGAASLATPQSAAAAGAVPAAVAAIPAGGSTRGESMDAGPAAAAVSSVAAAGAAVAAPRTAAGIAGLLLAADGTLLKPLIPISRAPGITPVVQRYRTVRGDSLWSISRHYGTDTMSLWWANTDRLRDGLKVGQMLIIPPGHGVLHAVAEGDTLMTIAAIYSSTPQSIVEANAMRGDVVIIGQLLLIPDGRGPSYPKGLLPGRPALEPSRPVLVDSAPMTYAGTGTIGGRDGFTVAPGRTRPSTLLAGGALHYGELVAGVLAGTRPSTAGGSGTTAGQPSPDDGPTGAGGGTASGPPSDGDGTEGGPVAATDEPWYLSASPELLDSWGISTLDHGSLVLVTGDDADRASRQLEAAAAREEARRVAAANPPAEQPEPVPTTPDEPAPIPQEGDPGISDDDQRKVPPFDPELARLAADLLRADMRRFPGSGSNTQPGQGDLPSSGETVYGLPTRSQLLEFKGTSAEQKKGITWLSWPVSGGRITQLYTRDHHGLDIAARSGSLIQTAAAGRVVWSGWRTNGGGFQVWVRHAPGLYTAYYHMSELLVRPGQLVPRGKAVGVIGSTGYAFGAHLHFELWRNGVPGSWDRRVNPMRYAKP